MNKLLKRLLSGAIAAAMVIGTLVMPAMAADGDPVISINFDETGTSPYTLHDGTITAGKFDNALSLAGSSNQYASINDVSAINTLNGDFTFNIWVKPSSLDLWARIFDIGTGSAAGDSYMFLCPSPWQNEGHPRFAIKLSNGTEQNMDADDAISTGEWSMITVVREGSITKMYINGKLSGTSTAITSHPSDMGATTNNYFGKSQFNDPYFNGMIDNFEVYNYALTDDTISMEYAEATVADKNSLEIDTQFYTNDKRTFTVEGNDVKASVPMSNEKDGYVVAAAYDGTALANVVTAGNGKLEAGMNSYTLQNVKTKATDTVKVYVWDSLNGITPIPDISVNNVFQISEGASVTVKTNVTNSTIASKTLKLGIRKLLKSGDSEELTLNAEATKTLSVLGSAEFSATITGAEDAASYQVYINDITDSENPVFYSAGFLPTAKASFPDASPEDTFATTFAAHDPTIFKDPKTGIYYAYNSGNALVGEYTDDEGNKQSDDADIDCFKSTDLIHWKRIDCGFRNPESAKTHINTIFNNRNSVPNGQSWAPDILYRPDDTEHPYWMYYSLSTTGTNAHIRSVIGLVKGKTPEGPWIDCGVVISSEEGYNTNAIDSNIYTDTNGDRYFIWGSYQKGIHQLKLRDDGLAEGIDYTSVQSIHTSSKTGTRLYSTPNGTQGPEGPWMINNTDTNYRYMFVSCGWLASTYNIRVARNSLDKSWADETASSSHHKLLDYKGRKVGTTFSEQTDISELWGYKMIGSYQLGDGITYYGNGHNSVLHDDDDNWYLVEHCRKQNGGYANLQVRKMLWTADDWPVVSPLVYAGEDEQEIPRLMILGTWDLSSVGHTILDSSISSVGAGSDEKVDLPVRSSKIILAHDDNVYKTDGTPIGTWSYDDNHTVTIEFEQDGDEDNYEFYQDGDVMTLYALTGYDKDQRESAVVMTGIDQNGITQFAKKNNAVDYPTKQTSSIETTPITLTENISTGGNPVLRADNNGNRVFTGDPAALVVRDKAYLYVGHDTGNATSGYAMPDYLCYSSSNMSDWKYEGVTMEMKNVTWANDKKSAWAGQVMEYNGKYYYYYCTTDKNIGGVFSIGVATSTSPTGPFEDKGSPIISGTTTTYASDDTKGAGHNDIDPTVLIDGDHIYLCWGNSKLYMCELDTTDPTKVKDITGDSNVTFGDSGDIKEMVFADTSSSTNFIMKNFGDNRYTEAPFLYKRGNLYYLFFAANYWGDVAEEMAYATAESPWGPWTFQSVIMPQVATSNTNHPAILDFNEKTYFIYHNGALPGGTASSRSVCVAEMEFNSDGTVKPIPDLSTGLNGIASTIKTGTDYIAHTSFINSLNASNYPVNVGITVASSVNDNLDAQWEITNGLYNPNDTNYVSIQSVNKPGCYIAISGNGVRLMHDALGNMTKKMTFKTVRGLNGDNGTVSFESVAKPGYFLTVSDGNLTITNNPNIDKSSFTVDTVE